MGNGFEPEVVKINGPADRDELLVHDAHSDSVHLAFWLSQVEHPIPLGDWTRSSGRLAPEV